MNHKTPQSWCLFFVPYVAYYTWKKTSGDATNLDVEMIGLNLVVRHHVQAYVHRKSSRRFSPPKVIRRLNDISDTANLRRIHMYA